MAPVDCLNVSANESDRFEISNECALFDFTVYTTVVGLMIALGVVGNALSFVVMLNDSATSATSFLLQALAVADTLVLLAAVPLYVLPNVYPYTGVFGAYYELYMGIMPFLWPIYLIPYTGTIFLTVLVSVNRYESVCRPFSTAKLCGNDKVGARTPPAIYDYVFVREFQLFFLCHAVRESAGRRIWLFNFRPTYFDVT